jgi:hypothetical protein
MTTQTQSGAPASAPRSRSGTPQVDSREFWRWVWTSIYPALGYILVLLGLIFIGLAWYGTARTAIVAKQIPYLASGGLFGIGAVVLGARFLVIQDIRRDSARLDRLEQMTRELHLALLSRADAPALEQRSASNGAAGGTRSASRRSTSGNGDGPSTYVVVPGGTTFHQADCPMLHGKEKTSRIRPSTVAKRNLAPCPLCEPAHQDGE